MKNQDLKMIYDTMHSQGSSAWFGSGDQERELILKMGEPWKYLNVLEIGCGEGELSFRMNKNGAAVLGIDYSQTAIDKTKKYLEIYERTLPKLTFGKGDYRLLHRSWAIDEFDNGDKPLVFNRLVMQGVLEHLDNPFTELKWMMDNLLTEKGDVITSSPCFTNPRGYIWMALDMVGAVMSKTDLHFLSPWQFEEFARDNGYQIMMRSCDYDWGYEKRMVEDLKVRIPLALRDGNIPYKQERLQAFLAWLQKASEWDVNPHGDGVNMVYRITK